MFTKARTVTALFVVTVAAAAAVSLGAASSAGASPISVLTQLKNQLQIQQQTHATFCAALMDRMTQDTARQGIPGSSGEADLAVDRATAIANDCPWI